ncbi:MAG: MFS transporter [Candidatus Binataceae bacterium]
MEDLTEDQRGTMMRFSAEQLKPIARRNSLLLGVILMFVWAGRQLLPTFGGMIAVQLTGSRSLSGTMFAIYMVAGSTGAWQAGRWMDRAGRRPALATGFIIAIVGAFIVGAAVVGHSFAFALFGAAIMGYGLGAGQLARLAAADMYPIHQRAKAVSYVLMGAAAGAVLGPMATAALEKLATAHGIDPIAGPWFVFPVLFLIGIVAVVMVRPDPRTIAIQVIQLDDETRGVMQVRALRSRRELLRMRPVWVAILAIAALETTMVMIMAIVPLGMSDMGYSLTLISTLIAVHFLGMFGLSIPIGWMADRFGRKPVLLTGCLISALGCVTIGLSSSVWLVGGGFFCVGLGWSLTYVTATTVLADVTHPHERAELIGIMDFSVAIGGATSSLAGGWIYGLAGLGVLGFLGAALTVTPFLAGLHLHENKVGVYEAAGPDSSSGSSGSAAAGS